MPPRWSLRPLAAIAPLCAIVLTAGSAQQQPPPQFRTGIDVTRVDVTVLDRRTRKPITGLTPDDFVVRVAGDTQRVVAVAEVTAPSASPAEGAVFVEAARDVASNEGPRPRLFLIVMNDADGQADPFDRQAGKAIAHRLIDGLGPADKAAVVFTRDNRHAQDFTADRTLLRRAAERFDPMETAGIVPFDVLLRAQAFLAAMPGYRRALVFITPVPRGTRRMPEASQFGMASDAETDDWRVRAFSAAATIGHVPLYLFSTHGLHAPDMSPQSRPGNVQTPLYQRTMDRLRSIADMTGGRAVLENNAPAAVVPAVLDELASYYALAYENTYPADGRRRWLDIQVKHPGAVVVPSRVLIAAAKPAASESAEAVLGPRRESGLFEALGAPLPAGDLPLRLSSVALPVAGKSEQAIALTLALPPVPAGAAEEFRARLLLFDGEGRRELRSENFQITFSGGEATAGEWTEVARRLDLRPGRYQLRVGVDRVSTGAAGSVHATLLVPDFGQDPLSLSGVAIGRAGGRPVAGRDTLGNLLPFAPTTVRRFAPDDSVGALLTVHQAPRRPGQAVTLETEIIDPAGAIVHGATRAIPAEAFADGAGVEHRFELPLASVGPGEYLLRFVATTASARAQRDVRFSVIP